ncbi:MAG: hypothetical protein MJ071_03125 [Oscillospiraceae bacterium]|nr:hypothetical protein [Oscillospiraceae bacterium]
MADPYRMPAQNMTISGEWTGGLSSEERREMSLRNLAMSKAEKAKKKKRRQQKNAERKISEAERRAKEEKRIREERVKRSEQSAENRREAGMQTDTPEASVPPSQPQKPIEKEQKKKTEKSNPTPVEFSQIEIDIPEETLEKQPKKKTKFKHKKQKIKHRAGAVEMGSAELEGTRKEQSGRLSHVSTGGAVCLGVLSCALIGMVIYGRVQTNELYTIISAKQEEYDDLVEKNVSMRSEMEGKMTVKKIEDYAENVLGLKPLDQSQIEYVQLQTEDDVIITEPEENIFVAINDYLVDMWEYLQGK